MRDLSPGSTGGGCDGRQGEPPGALEIATGCFAAAGRAGWPAHAREEELDFGRKRCSDSHRRVLERMLEGEVGGHEEQPVDAQFPVEEEVVRLITVFMIADYGMRGVGEVTPDLVVATGAGVDPNQGVSSCSVSPDWGVKLHHCQSLKLGDRGDTLFPIAALQRLIETSLCIEEAADDREIALVDISLSEQLGECGSGRSVECVDEDA